MMFLPEHKLGKFYTKQGFDSEVAKLKELIKKDMEEIDYFVKRWHELHKPIITDWEGNRKK
jgi:ubiquinone biosynthesis protein Coq4